MSARGWLFVTLGQLAVVAACAAVGNVVASRAAAGGEPEPTVVTGSLAAIALVALIGFIACVPIAGLRLFVAGQHRIGNEGHPVVGFLAEHQRAAVGGVWMIWLLGAIIAAPFMIRE